MDEILRLARALGKAISGHKAFMALRQAEQAAGADEDAAALIEALAKQQQHINELGRDGKPIEPEDKHKAADLQQKLMANETLKNLQAAQVDFKHLMDTVNRAIQEPLEPDEKPQGEQADA